MSTSDRLPERAPVPWDEYADAVPGLARIAAATGVRAGVWGLKSGLRSTRLLARAMTDPAAAGELIQGVATDVAQATRTISDVARAVSDGVPLPKALIDGSVSLSQVVLPGTVEAPPVQRELTLRERGEELLQKSRDVWREEEQHPAYARILNELAPDEARILSLLMRGGPQPSVDVRTGGPAGMMNPTLIAAKLNMIGSRAGLRRVDQTPAYLTNLQRLGLIWFSSEQLDDPLEYQVVEAQPDVLEAMHAVRFPKMIRRSIHLTPLGVNFTKLCLIDADEVEGAPEHEIPSGLPSEPTS